MQLLVYLTPALVFCATLCAGAIVEIPEILQSITQEGAPICPLTFDFSSGRTCYKYVTDKLYTRDEAERYCATQFYHIGGKLARLRTHDQLIATARYFGTIFEAERQSYNERPTAWTDGTWIPGTKMMLYGDNSINTSPRWMPKSLASQNEVITWPTYRFGYDAICVAVSLWEKRQISPRKNAVFGMYNVPCGESYRANALCEVEI